MKQLFLNYKTLCSLRLWIIFSEERCEDTKIKVDVGMHLYQEQACTPILLCIVKMVQHTGAYSELFILCLCRQMLWICLSLPVSALTLQFLAQECQEVLTGFN